MGAMPIIDQVMGSITRSIEDGDAARAVEQWYYLANTLGRCEQFCGTKPDLCIQTCGACLIAKLVGVAHVHARNTDEGERYSALARDLQALIASQYQESA